MPENTVNPDIVVQRAMQAQLNLFRANENAASALKFYNDALMDMANTMGLMKGRILELEEEMKKKDGGKKS